MVSVCLLAYNGEKHIEQQIRSILLQLSVSDELIVSDDGSSDRTLEIVASFGDPRIRLLSHPPQTNPYLDKNPVFRNVWAISANCAFALSHTRGDIVFLSDQDDIWREGKIEEMCNALKTCGLAIHDCTVVSQNGTVLIESYFSQTPPRISFLGLLRKSSFMGCCMAFRRSLLEYALPFPKFLVEHDAWLGICALRHGRVGVVGNVLLDYRRHGNNISSCGEKSPNPVWVKLLRRIYLFRSYFRAL